MRRILTAFAAASLIVVACANPADIVDVPETGAPDTGGSKDASVKDSSGKDVEVVKDSGVDSTVLDAGVDATLDAAVDATLDAGPDVVDSGPDVVDSGPDVVDSGPDVVDSGPDVVVVDGGSTNDTCQQATVLSSGVPISGDTTNANDDYDVNVNLSLVCSFTDLTFYQFDGNDLAYAISVPNGKTVNVTVTPTTQWDVALAIVGDCGNIGPTCLGGDDFNGSGAAETGTFTNTSGQTKTVYIVVDSYSSTEYGPFTLSATVQ